MPVEVDATAIEDALNEQTNGEWRTLKTTPAELRFASGSWELVVGARNPTTDNTWRLTLKDRMDDKTYAIGPVKSYRVVTEAEAFVTDHL